MTPRRSITSFGLFLSGMACLALAFVSLFQLIEGSYGSNLADVGALAFAGLVLIGLAGTIRALEDISEALLGENARDKQDPKP